MPSDPKTRVLHVLVVDDSAVVRQTLLAMLQTSGHLSVDVAPNADIALEKIQRRKPDVMVLDLEMPGMHGLTLLRKLMRENPLPVIVCSRRAEHDDLARRALAEGAVKVIAKPQVDVKTFLHDSAAILKAAIQSAATGQPWPVLSVPSPIGPASIAGSESLCRTIPSTTCRVIAIGASTGGPDAIPRVLSDLPSSAPGVVVVQHMTDSFIPSFARRLNELCALKVEPAEPGSEILPGSVLVAPGNRHLVVCGEGKRLFVDVIEGPLVARHRPSVNVLFHSVAETVGRDAIGVLLSGMGDDGADGLRGMREAGAWTIAQSAEGCAVFGMPKAAIARGAATDVLPLTSIGPALAAATAGNDWRWRVTL